MNGRTLVFLSLVAAPAAAQEADPKNELTVFGGVAILDASRSSDFTFESGGIPGFPDLPMIPGLPGTFPGITARVETAIGSSPLFGVRYSRRIKDRVAVETDFAIAPTHDLETRGEICVEGFPCFGRGQDLRSDLTGRFGGRGVVAWHYGAGLAYELQRGDVRPYLLVGAGGVSWDGASDTDFVFRFGGGLKILFGKLGLRVDVVDHLVIDHFLTEDNEHDVHATAGFLVGF